MAVKNAMFIFEVVVESVKSFVESRFLVIKCEFADIFALELKDPKQMHIVMPEPLPLPPEPPGKKGKKKAKPKPKKGKKGKKGAVELPPPEPIIQSGQSVLFTSSAEFLLQNMKESPMVISLWSKEEDLVFIGAAYVPWDPVFLTYLERVFNCENPPAPLVRDDYNIFQEGSAKMMAQLGIQVKLTYLTDKILASFRTLSEDPIIKKVLYTGMNSKTTSYMCTMKTTDEDFEQNCNKIENNYIKDKPAVFADYKNAPGVNLAFFSDGDYCCMRHADKPPDSKYKSPETCPDIDFIADYVRKVINSCNDNMRMLTPRPTIRPRIKATDIDKLCYCRETSWPQGKLVERFRKEVQGGPCPVCIDAGKDKRGEGKNVGTFDLANLRGPCGKHDCRIARQMRAYIENLVTEDNQEIDLNEIIGPCGSRSCTLAERIQDFIRHKGPFAAGITEQGLSTQCTCIQLMQNALTKRQSCASICSKDCSTSDSEASRCGGKGCPYHSILEQKQVYQIYYCTVEYAFEKTSPTGSSGTLKTQPSQGNISQGNSSSHGNSPSRGNSPSHGKIGNSPQLSKSPSHGNSPQHSKSPSHGNSPSRSNIPQDSKSPSHGNSPKHSKSSSHTNMPSHSTSATHSKTNVPPTTSKPAYRYCSKECPSKSEEVVTCSKSACATTIRDDATKLEIAKLKCVNPVCPSKSETKLLYSPADSDYIIHFNDIHNPCCVKTCEMADKVKDFISDVFINKSKSKLPTETDAPCFCDCDCTFKFSGKTTYCAVCGGYECLGEDVRMQPEYAKPHPCPIYHKLYDKKYIKVQSAWPDEQKGDKQAADAISIKSVKTAVAKAPQFDDFEDDTDQAEAPQSDKSRKKGRASRKSSAKRKTKSKGSRSRSRGKKEKKVDKSDSEKKGKKKKGKKRNEYQTSVPNRMGWLWTAQDIPGMKFRPNWKPGAANRILVRRYRAMREGVENILKKKRALMQRKKKIEMRPTLVVTKTDGEYTVAMEIFRKYSKDRLLYQYPYEEKLPLTYTIGKTPEEKRRIQMQRERKERRIMRRKSRLLQSTFRDKCQEICVKAYNQAIGLLPLPNANLPECPCETEPVPHTSPPVDSCSCSEDGSISSSDTDGDDWIIEFTPPLARWDPKAKHPVVINESETQYTYLDYKVKLVDKQGNPVPRFFKGPDGKQECSDLGGFWSPEHIWLEINKDGFIGPDCRWVPLNFIGPDGMNYSSEEGTFTDANGGVWKIGVDGYIDKDGKWVWYSRRPGPRSTISTATATASTMKPRAHKTDLPKSALPTKPKFDTKAPITGKMDKTAKAAGTTTGKEKHVTLPGLKNKKSPLVMNVSMNYDRRSPVQTKDHLKPMDPKKAACYKEIMEGLQMYDDLVELKPTIKTNRASNTPKRKLTGQAQTLMTVNSSVSSRPHGSLGSPIPNLKPFSRVFG